MLKLAAIFLQPNLQWKDDIFLELEFSSYFLVPWLDVKKKISQVKAFARLNVVKIFVE